MSRYKTFLSVTTPPTIEQHPSGQRLSPDCARWEERYRQGHNSAGGEISAWVQSQQPYLRGGQALDVACGVGRHTLWLARLGYQVDGVDISAAALAQVAAAAVAQGVAAQLRLIQADLNIWRPEPGRYDLILITRYLNRDLFAHLAAALRPDGMVLYRSMHTDLLRLHPDFRADYLLQPGELLQVFRSWQILAYEERRWRPGSSDFADCSSAILARKP